MRRVGAAGAFLAIAGLLAGRAGGQEVLQSPYLVTPPDIDSVVGEGEWGVATRLTLPSRDGSAQCVFLVMTGRSTSVCRWRPVLARAWRDPHRMGAPVRVSVGSPEPAMVRLEAP